MSDLGEEERAEWQRSRSFLNQHVHSYVRILVYGECTDIAKYIIDTPAGKFEGGAKITGRTRFIGTVGVLGPAFGPHAAFADQ